MEAIEDDPVQGVREQACDGLAVHVARHGEVVRLLTALGLNLDQKAVKDAPFQSPGHQEAVPRHVGDSDTTHLGLLHVWMTNTSTWH